MMFMKFLSLMFLFAILSPGYVTGCGSNNCIGDNCISGNQCKSECNDNCHQECGGMGWRRHGRWDDEEECFNECDVDCSGNCRNNGGNNRILGALLPSGMGIMNAIQSFLG